MKKTMIIVTVLLLLGAGGGYYYYHQEKKREEAERLAHDSIRRAHEAELARLAAIDQARRDSTAAYEKTHAPAVIMLRMEQLLREEIRSNRNRLSGKNWTERMNILREQCENVLAYSGAAADTVYRSFSFKGLMGDSISIHGDSIMRVYHVTTDSAYVDVHFNIGEKHPEGQDVAFKLKYIGGQWLLDDFTFQYTDGQYVTESEEMRWFIDTYGKAEATEPEKKE